MDAATQAPSSIPLTGTSGRRRSLWATNRTRCLEKSNGRRHFCLSVFIPWPSVTSPARQWHTAGYVARECDAHRDVLEMGLESQQEWFKRLTLVSNSMGPVTGIFQDGLFYAVASACTLPACREATTLIYGTSIWPHMCANGGMPIKNLKLQHTCYHFHLILTH